jgi:hypothetical protein
MAVDYMATLALYSHCYVTEAVITKTSVIKITGYPLQIFLTKWYQIFWWYCGIFAQDKNCETSSDSRYSVTASQTSMFPRQKLDTTEWEAVFSTRPVPICWKQDDLLVREDVQDEIQGPGSPGWGSLESETVKYGHESRGTRTLELRRWRGPAAIVNDRPILSPKRLLHKDYYRKNTVGKNLWSWVSRGLTPWRTD